MAASVAAVIAVIGITAAAPIRTGQHQANHRASARQVFHLKRSPLCTTGDVPVPSHWMIGDGCEESRTVSTNSSVDVIIDLDNNTTSTELVGVSGNCGALFTSCSSSESAFYIDGHDNHTITYTLYTGGSTGYQDVDVYFSGPSSMPTSPPLHAELHITVQ
jgi:hypothetical protein